MYNNEINPAVVQGIYKQAASDVIDQLRELLGLAPSYAPDAITAAAMGTAGVGGGVGGYFLGDKYLRGIAEKLGNKLVGAEAGLRGVGQATSDWGDRVINQSAGRRERMKSRAKKLGQKATYSDTYAALKGAQGLKAKAGIAGRAAKGVGSIPVDAAIGYGGLATGKSARGVGKALDALASGSAKAGGFVGRHIPGTARALGGGAGAVTAAALAYALSNPAMRAKLFG